MQVVKSLKALQARMIKLRNQNKIAFVPTMGFLHEGHLSLVRLAKKKADIVVVSIFVNPKQFNQKSDLKNYPKNLKNDLSLLKKEGVDVVFTPTAESLYPENFQTQITVEKISKNLCGQSRPGHFEGVAVIVLKLFHLVQPHIAIFGQKDYQQSLIIQQLVKDLNLPIQILIAPIVREKSGLAMSSRNVRLSEVERQQALVLFSSLKIAKSLSRKKSVTLFEIRKALQKQLKKQKSIRIDYLEFRHKKTLEKIKVYQKGKTLIAIAAYVGKVRLIDNVII